MPPLPARMLAVASSTGGKTFFMQNLILKICRNSFRRIYIFSPSVDVDDTWNAVKKYIKDVMKVDLEMDQIYFNFNHSGATALHEIIDTQHKVIEFQNKNKDKDLFSMLVIMHDFTDDLNFVRYSSTLHGLFTRGRHNAISVYTVHSEVHHVSPNN